MDDLQFDFIARAAHETPSRRRFFAGVAGVAAALVAGRVSLDDALAQELSTSKFDLACKQAGTTYFCAGGGRNDNTMQCGPNRCRCARLRRNNGRVCVEQPPGGCPGRREACRRNRDCSGNQVCIKVPDCCPRHRGRGVCTDRCDEG